MRMTLEKLRFHRQSILANQTTIIERAETTSQAPGQIKDYAARSMKP